MGKKKFNFGKLVKDAGREIRGAAKSMTNNVKDVISMPQKTLQQGLGTLSSMSMPIMIVGGIVLFIMVKNAK